MARLYTVLHEVVEEVDADNASRAQTSHMKTNSLKKIQSNICGVSRRSLLYLELEFCRECAEGKLSFCTYVSGKQLFQT